MLGKDWVPGFGVIHTWFAIDINGCLAMMVNNGFGGLPSQLLRVDQVEILLDKMNEFIWEESAEYVEYPQDKGGSFEVDLYSAFMWREFSSREEVRGRLQEELLRSGRLADANVAKNKGFYVYHAVEGSFPGDDYPVGHIGESKMGDYYRFMVPGVLGSINDFPSELRKGVAVSTSVDFSVDRLLPSDRLSELFPCLYFCSLS